jgi:hypothetical protein
MSQDPEQAVLRAIDATKTALVSVSNTETQFVDHENFDSLDEIVESLTPLESAKFDVAVAYNIASLYYVLLRAKGVSQQSHPIKAELDRIKGYVLRLKRVADEVEKAAISGSSAGASATASGVSDEAISYNVIGSRPAADASAAKRMISHELGLKRTKDESVAKTTEEAKKSTNKRQKTR